MGFSNSAYRRLNTFEISFTGKPQDNQYALTTTTQVDTQVEVETGETGVEDASKNNTSASPNATTIAARLKEMGINIKNPKSSLKFFTTSEFGMNFASQSQDLLGVSFGSMNKLAGIFGESFMIDYPQAVLYTGMEPISWGMDAFLSIYESPDESKEYNDIDDLIYARYVVPLATILAVILPMKSDRKMNLEDTIKQITGILSNIAPNLFSTSLVKKGEQAAESAASVLDDLMNQASKGTVFNAIMKNAYYVEPPVQFSAKTDPGGGLGMSMTFAYGPVVVQNVLIKSLKMSYGNLVLRNSKQVGIPEVIKLHFEFTSQFKPTLDFMKPTLQRMTK